MTRLEIKNNYIDITEEYMKGCKTKGFKIKELRCFNYCGKQYFVDNKKVVLDYGNEEVNIAKYILKKFGGDIFMLPRINYPDGIKTPDFLWNNGYWNLKTILGKGKNTIDSAIKKKQNQACNFILDISFSKMNIYECERQVKAIFNNNKRKWINKVIIKDGENIKVYKKRN